MIVLKNLVREFDINPHKLRQILRDKFGVKHAWRWKDENDKQYKKVRQHIINIKEKKNG